MARTKQAYSLDQLKDIAKKFATRTEFNRYDRKAYNAAKNSGVYDEVCKHMGPPHQRESTPYRWTKESIKEVAKRYKTRWAFGKENKSAYGAALKYGWLDEVCAHMTPSPRYNDEMTVRKALEESEKYATMIAFREHSPREYWFLHRAKLLSAVSSDMSRCFRAYDKSLPGTVYLIELTADFLDKPVYKVGVTNKTVSQRISAIGLLPGVQGNELHEILFADGNEALAMERQIHKESVTLRHTGQRVTRRGVREIYSEIPARLLHSIAMAA